MLNIGKLVTLSLVAAATVTAVTAAEAQTRKPDPRFEQWSAVRGPLQTSNPRVIGGYSSGCIAGAQALPLDGTGYLVLRPFRNRYYGHPNLVNYLRDLGSRANQAGLPKIMIGDMSSPRGGPFLRGHSSHQTGLDVDISFSFARGNMTTEQRNAWVDPSFVENRRTLKREWTDNHDKLIELAATSSRVARIFVSPGIKKHFCDTQPRAPWLYKLRGWWGHDDHLHVRLNCPEGDSRCVAQPALDSSDNGCGSDLASWFTRRKDEEAAALERHWAQPNPPPKRFPSIPSRCEAVLTAE